MSEKLTTKQRLFVEAYLVTSNATESARRAGYKGNANTLAQVGDENLKKPKIAELVSKRVEKAVMTADEWMTEVAELARQAEKDSDRLTAYGLLGKPLNLTNNVKNEHSGEVVIATRVIEPGE
jgi:phage terminase small subunit